MQLANALLMVILVVTFHCIVNFVEFLHTCKGIQGACSILQYLTCNSGSYLVIKSKIVFINMWPQNLSNVPWGSNMRYKYKIQKFIESNMELFLSFIKEFVSSFTYYPGCVEGGETCLWILNAPWLTDDWLTDWLILIFSLFTGIESHGLSHMQSATELRPQSH